MNRFDKKYIIHDISVFAAYLYENLDINEKDESIVKVIQNYFQQTEAYEIEENETVFKPHRPTQKEFELFWNK